MTRPMKKGGAGPKKEEENPMENKFNKVLAWGTPRIVHKTKGVTLNMNSKQLGARNILANTALVRKGLAADKSEGPK